MTLAFDLPRCARSPLADWDGRWKLAGLALLALAAAFLRTPGPAIVALLLAFVLAAAGRLPWRWLFVRLGSLSLFLLLFLFWLPFLHPGARWEHGWISLSLDGLVLALMLWLKAMTLVTLALVILASQPLHEVCHAAYHLHVPRLMLQLFLLTFRYVFLLAEEFARLRTALRVRGFRSRASLHSYRTIAQVAGTLLVRSEERAERVSQAMRCRGFDGQFRSLHEFHTRLRDVLVFVTCLVLAAVLITWDFCV